MHNAPCQACIVPDNRPCYPDNRCLHLKRPDTRYHAPETKGGQYAPIRDELNLRLSVTLPRRLKAHHCNWNTKALVVRTMICSGKMRHVIERNYFSGLTTPESTYMIRMFSRFTMGSPLRISFYRNVILDPYTGGWDNALSLLLSLRCKEIMQTCLKSYLFSLPF